MIIEPTEKSKEAMQAKTQAVPPVERSGGGGSGVQSVEVTPILQTGTKIATIEVDDDSKDIYAPEGLPSTQYAMDGQVPVLRKGVLQDQVYEYVNWESMATPSLNVRNNGVDNKKPRYFTYNGTNVKPPMNDLLIQNGNELLDNLYDNDTAVSSNTAYLVTEEANQPASGTPYIRGWAGSFYPTFYLDPTSNILETYFTHYTLLMVYGYPVAVQISRESGYYDENSNFVSGEVVIVKNIDLSGHSYPFLDLPGNRMISNIYFVYNLANISISASTNTYGRVSMGSPIFAKIDYSKAQLY